MRGALITLMAGVTVLAACTGVQKEPQPLFASRTGIAGGNEFNARSQDGPDDQYAAIGGGKAGAGKAVPAPSAPPAPPAAPPPVVAVAAADAAPVAVAAALPTRIDIDANAYGAVFGTAPAPVKPTPAQLMQLDSLSLVVAEALRVDLQKRILECRRAGDACRLGAR